MVFNHTIQWRSQPIQKKSKEIPTKRESVKQININLCLTILFDKHSSIGLSRNTCVLDCVWLHTHSAHTFALKKKDEIFPFTLVQHNMVFR